MRTVELSTGLCVVGGGPAGLCTALAAARKGIKVVLMQNRAMLGGNSSSEIRMSISVAHDAAKRETGIIEELQLDNFFYNQGLKFPLWDNVLYSKIIAEPNIRLLLNCNCMQADCENMEIRSVSGWQMTSETWYIVKAGYFADCSGDSILAPLSGAAYMMGREDKEMFGEALGLETADQGVMGKSILIQFRETNEKQTFVPPPWAEVFPDDSRLEGKLHTLDQNFWWIEYGGLLDILHDHDQIHEQLLKIAYGVVDHLKNQSDHGLDNWELEWVGCLPGGRESRRYVGRYIITQNDVDAGGPFEDAVAYACWTMDNHYPEGFYYPGRIAVNYPVPDTWGIPLRSLYARDYKNLTFAGRNLSASHLAFSSARVMSACGLMGQALGTAVAMAVKEKIGLDDLDVETLQQQLLFDDCFLPGRVRKISDITLNARTNTGVVKNATDRGDENCWTGGAGDSIELAFESQQKLSYVRIVFDSNLDRPYNNMPSCYPMDQPRFKLPESLVKAYRVVGIQPDGSLQEICVTDNHQRLVIHEIDWEVVGVRLIPLTSWGADELRVFGFEVG